ncbi:hypothetical protein [Marinobacter pelagius]|uniref:hypothetical protein n=1 Tax=Marinobacter pelagius TaxID=379482 RepID=UPI0011BED920|nr:hypothetical protein [Marinobacter pelagius]
MVILISIAFSGCASLPGQSKKYREGNRVISESYPAATFGFSSDYEFLSSGEKMEKVSADASTISTGKFKSQTFAYAVTFNNEIQRLAVVQFNAMASQGWTWTDSPEWTGPGVIAGDRSSELGELQTWTTFGRTLDTLSYFDIDIKGHTISPCVAVVTSRRIPPAMSRFKQLIHYIEPINCTTSNQFHYSDGSLTKTGRYRLDKAYENALSNILILSND